MKELKDRYIYPAIFTPCEQSGYIVTFPDLPGIVSKGGTIEETLLLAKEALELHLFAIEEENEPLPEARHPRDVEIPEGGFMSLIEAFMPLFREKMANKSISATVTLPRWLKSLAEENDINFSHVLQAGLKERLGVYEFRKIPKIHKL